MGCSKDKVVSDMLKKGLVTNGALKLSSVPSVELMEYIDDITRIAKNKYNVDMGPLFYVKSRTVSVGDYSVLRNQSIKTILQLHPNESAFEAIDRSKEMEQNERDLITAEMQHQATQNYFEERDKEALVRIEEGDVLSQEFNTQGLPIINLEC